MRARERRAEHILLEAEAKPAPHAAIDQTKTTASKLGGVAGLWPAVVALLFLTAASGWFALAGTGTKTMEAARLSIVVLPFVNLSGDAAPDYLVDALTDELTTSLARISGTISGQFVIARNTAMTYKGKPVDAKAIGKDLGVRYVLEGSVQFIGAQARVNAQLIDADSGAHVWAEQFDTTRADLLQMQDEIVIHLARAMEEQLDWAEAARLMTHTCDKSQRRGFGSSMFCGRAERWICQQRSRCRISSLRAGAPRRSQQYPRPVGLVDEVPRARPIRRER